MDGKKFNALPGFGLTMGFTLLYLSAIVLIPFAGLVIRACGLSWSDFYHLATTDRALAAYRLTFGASAIAALVNAIFGTLVGWVLVRYEFPGRRFLDAMVDFPFALPTAVAGLTLANLYSPQSWFGQILLKQQPDGTMTGFKGAVTPFGGGVALTFLGVPFVGRALQPVLEG